MRIQRFFRAVYHDNDLRRTDRRRLAGDVKLYVRNRILQPADRLVSELARDDALPICFVVGSPRSGTTLSFQLLTRGLQVGYPTNAVARWFSAPALGALLEGPRPWTRSRDMPLRSRYGGTEGRDSPHEFSWFWNYHAPFERTDDLTPAELDALPWPALRRSLSAMAGLAGRPLVLKSLNWTVYHVERFARELPQARFLYIHRDPRFVVQSILRCRVERYGDERIWWTIRPRDVEQWLDRDPIDQVCHQVTDIDRAIEHAHEKLPEGRFRRVAYEDLVQDPERFLDDWGSWLGTRRVPGPVATAAELVAGNQIQDSERFAAIEDRLRLIGAWPREDH